MLLFLTFIRFLGQSYSNKKERFLAPYRTKFINFTQPCRSSNPRPADATSRCRGIRPIETAYRCALCEQAPMRNRYTVSAWLTGYAISAPFGISFSGVISASSPFSFSAQRSIPSERTPASVAGFKFTRTITFLPTISSAV